MIHAGRTIHARPVNQAENINPASAAAQGGSRRSWLRGRPTKPRFVMTVGRYHVNAYPLQECQLRDTICSNTIVRLTQDLQAFDST
jgi:hypothetical protein